MNLFLFWLFAKDRIKRICLAQVFIFSRPEWRCIIQNTVGPYAISFAFCASILRSHCGRVLGHTIKMFNPTYISSIRHLFVYIMVIDHRPPP